MISGKFLISDHSVSLYRILPQSKNRNTQKMLSMSVQICSNYFSYLSLFRFWFRRGSLTSTCLRAKGTNHRWAKHPDIAADRPQLLALIWHGEKTKCPLQRTATHASKWRSQRSFQSSREVPNSVWGGLQFWWRIDQRSLMFTMRGQKVTSKDFCVWVTSQRKRCLACFRPSSDTSNFVDSGAAQGCAAAV